MEVERLGEGEEARGASKEGREEEVGVEIWGIRRPLVERSRGLAIVDILRAKSGVCEISLTFCEVESNLSRWAEDVVVFRME